jgi:serine/threonine-protein kinase HipA
MNRELIVHVEREGGPVPCGRLWARSAPRESASFEYDPSWLARRDAFSLDPELPLGRGQFHTAQPLFRAFTDPAPDRWGQTLLRRAERARARREGRIPRTLTGVDFLALVDDQTRLGALRFQDATATEKGFLSSGGKPIPPVLALPKLLSASQRLIDEEETDDDLALVLAPGTSLGGARPKASVLATDGRLLVAKFPRKDDDWPVTRWEAATLELARLASIAVPVFRLETVLRRPVLVLDRFDRDGARRIPFMSSMTALSANDNEAHSYLDLVEAVRREGSRVTEDLRELWRRMVFNVLVSNTDDHLRNHGFLREDDGWRLAPAYDLNPMPAEVRPRVHALALDEADATSSLETALEVAPRFGLAAAEARRIAGEVGRVVRGWRSIATKFGLRAKDLERMETAFQHQDLELAGRASPSPRKS